MGIVRDLYYARKMSAGLKLPAPTVALLIKRLRLAAAMGGGVTKTVSGTMVHITDALAKAALSVLASIEPIQDLHGYANPWPAGGGVNKLLPINVDYTTSPNGLTLTYELSTESFSITGTNQKTDTTWLVLQASGFVLPTLEIGGTYYYAHNLPSTLYSQITYNKSGGGAGSLAYRAGTGAFGYSSFTVPNDYNGNARFQIGCYASTGQVDATGIVFEISETPPTAWSPYSNICPISGLTGLSVYVGPTQDQQDATTYSVDWTAQAGTVYGGTVDVVTGELTVDTVHFSFDGTENWTKSGTYNGSFYLNTGIPMKWPSDKNVCSHAIACDTFPAGYQFGTYGLDGVNKVNVNIWLMPSGSSKQDWLDYLAAQALAGTPVEMVCELTTPLTYQLSAQEVQMLLGENYVWSSSGDTVSVTYYAEGNANTLQSLNILLGGNYSNPKTVDDVSDKEALDIILGGNK